MTDNVSYGNVKISEVKDMLLPRLERTSSGLRGSLFAWIAMFAMLSPSWFALGCGLGAVPPERKAEMMTQLQSAKKLDEHNLADLRTDPAEAVDSMRQKYKADHAIRELEHGYEVSSEEFADAIMVPPKSISAEERAALIARLEKVEGADRETMLPITGESVRQRIYSEHGEQTAEVIKDLEIGEDVPWSRIQQAMVHP